MGNVLYPVVNTPGSNTAYAQDFNQTINTLNGTADTGDITAYAEIAAPGALTAAGGASGSLTGAYSYRVTFITGLVDGKGALHPKGETAGGTTSTTVNVSTQNINLTNIPIGPTGTIARKVYRTIAGGSVWLLAFQISDNTTTSWTDIIVDTALGAAVPTTNTTGSRFVGDGSGLTGITATSVGAIPTSAEGAANGVATLDASGNVPKAQLGNVPPSNLITMPQFWGM